MNNTDADIIFKCLQPHLDMMKEVIIDLHSDIPLVRMKAKQIIYRNDTRIVDLPNSPFLGYGMERILINFNGEDIIKRYEKHNFPEMLYQYEFNTDASGTNTYVWEKINTRSQFTIRNQRYMFQNSIDSGTTTYSSYLPCKIINSLLPYISKDYILEEINIDQETIDLFHSNDEKERTKKKEKSLFIMADNSKIYL